jgi:hypothetical protein
MPTGVTQLLSRVVVFAAAGSLIVPGAAFGATPLVVVSVRGKITSLSPKRIEVGSLSCSIRSAEVRNRAARFDVGDRVRIACRGGILQTLKRVPVPSSDTSPPAGEPTVTIAVGGPATTRGPISSFGPTSITINDITCAISPDLYSVIKSMYSVGDTATIVCDPAGQLRAIGPNGI